MNIEIITKQDLEKLKDDLLHELTELLKNGDHASEREYLRSKEVRKILGVSNGTLSNMRVKGLLHPTKIEGVYYYKFSEIKKLLSGNI